MPKKHWVDFTNNRLIKKKIRTNEFKLIALITVVTVNYMSYS